MKRTLILVVTVLVALLALGPKKDAQAAEEIVTGTGAFTFFVTSAVQVLSDCGDFDSTTGVSFVTRVGAVAFSGAISTGTDGEFTSTLLREACAQPVVGTLHSDIRFLEATVGGRTGALRIELEGVFDGDAASPGGVRTRGHGTVTGVSGGLRGARGRIQFVGMVTTTSNSNFYFLEIQLK